MWKSNKSESNLIEKALYNGAIACSSYSTNQNFLLIVPSENYFQIEHNKYNREIIEKQKSFDRKGTL